MRLSVVQPVVVRPKNVPNWLRYSLVALALIVLWQLYVSYGGVNHLLVASPLTTLQALITDIQDGQLPTATINTIQNLLIGIVISIILGVLLASLSTFSRIGHDVLTVLTATLSPLPGIAILPLAMLWFGLTPTAIIVVVVHSAVWTIAISTDTGFRTISATTRLVALNLGLSKWRTITDVYLPAALPHILSGFRLAWSFGWRTVVGAELVFGVTGSAGGLGWYIANARYFLNTPPMFAGLVVISVLGIVVDGLFLLVERSTVVKWGMKQRAH